MRIKSFLFLLPVLLFAAFACKTKLDVNANWKDITVVYGLLNQNDSIHYLKITKAFLGEGNALIFAKVPDSSNYKHKLEVKMYETVDGTVIDSSTFDTTIIKNKEAGDSIFYYPDQLMYVTHGKLNENAIYKIKITEPETGKVITSQTQLVHKFTDISKPQPAPAKASFIPGMKNQAVWTSVQGGKRYQLVAKFYYLEVNKADTSIKVEKSVDWIIFNDLVTDNTAGGEQMEFSYPSDAFYIVLGNHIKPNPIVSRAARRMEYIFTVAADDLNTYMEVTEPSSTIVQEKPPFTNITNGIGLFSARYDNTKDRPIIQVTFSQQTLDQLKVNPNTSDLGF